MGCAVRWLSKFRPSVPSSWPSCPASQGRRSHPLVSDLYTFSVKALTICYCISLVHKCVLPHWESANNLCNFNVNLKRCWKKMHQNGTWINEWVLRFNSQPYHVSVGSFRLRGPGLTCSRMCFITQANLDCRMGLVYWIIHGTHPLAAPVGWLLPLPYHL
jgi:hypothetical protein